VVTAEGLGLTAAVVQAALACVAGWSPACARPLRAESARCLASRLLAMLRSAYRSALPCAYLAFTIWETPMSVRSTRVKAALGFAGLLIATASAAAAGPASAATQGGDSTYIVL